MSDIKRAIALGFFDGVHVGHAALLNKTKERSEEHGYKPSVLSFDVHPDNLVFGTTVPLINSAYGRERIIHDYFGIRDVVFIHFNHSVMRMPWEQFAEQIISELNVAHIVVGHDFCFGYKGQGTAARLKAYCEERGIGCDIIPAVIVDGETVSSTHIRQLLKNGEITQANKLLGHPHTLFDTVHSGHHLGTKLGAPTINMFFPQDVLVPKFGVYSTMVCLPGGEKYPAVTNIGVRPTVSGDNNISVESHLIDYSGDLYGKEISLEFYDYIRPEIKFDSVELLTAQILSDIQSVRELRGKMADCLISKAAILGFLPDGADGSKLCVVESVQSTNSYLLERCFELPDGYVLIAEHQSAGRGMHGKSFFSPPSTGVYLSILVRDSAVMNKAQYITTACAVAVCRAIEKLTGLRPEIKWVNDIYMGGRKVCGILTEARFARNGLSAAVIGIGVNVICPVGGFPAELSEKAGYIFEKALPKMRERLCAGIISEINMILPLCDSAEVTDAYTERSMAFGRSVVFSRQGETVNALAVGIDKERHLIVRHNDGRTEALSSAELDIL